MLGSRSGMEVLEKIRIYCCPYRNPESTAPRMVTIPSSLSSLLLRLKNKWKFTSVFLNQQVRNRTDSKRNRVAIEV
jgi:hypothetical protein